LKVRGKITVASYSRQWFGSHPMSPHTKCVYDAILRVHILPTLGGRAKRFRPFPWPLCCGKTLAEFG
jgi:hypothetical protein